jgi:hypothetical protein
VRRRERGVLEVLEQPQLLLEEEGAVEAAVGVLDFVQRGELTDGLVLRGLQQRPAHALDPATVPGGALALLVPFAAADIIDGALSELDDMKRVEADLCVGEAWRIAFS